MSEVTTSPIRQQPIQGNLVQQPDAEVGEELVVDEGSQQAVAVSSEQAPSFWDTNVHNQARIESANIPNDYFVSSKYGDWFAYTGLSTEDGVFGPNMDRNVNRLLGAAGSDMGELQLSVNGDSVSVPGLSLRELRMNQDKYPQFLVLGRPTSTASSDNFNLHVTYKESGKVLNQEETVLFVKNVAIPAITADMHNQAATEVA